MKNQLYHCISKIIFSFFVAICFIVIIIAGFKIDRWFNWKLSYESKVNKSIEQLQKRIEILENKEVNYVKDNLSK